MLRFSLIAALLLGAPELSSAQDAPVGWPQVTANLAKERTQAVACVGLVKSHGNQAAIDSAKATYASAKGEIDGVIVGLTTALVQGGNPRSLSTLRASLAEFTKGLTEICATALKSAQPNTKGVWDAIAKGVVEGATVPIVKAISDGMGALWRHHLESEQLVVETIKTQLEAARWPDFSDVAAQ